VAVAGVFRAVAPPVGRPAHPDCDRVRRRRGLLPGAAPRTDAVQPGVCLAGVPPSDPRTGPGRHPGLPPAPGHPDPAAPAPPAGPAGQPGRAGQALLPPSRTGRWVRSTIRCRMPSPSMHAVTARHADSGPVAPAAPARSSGSPSTSSRSWASVAAADTPGGGVQGHHRGRGVVCPQQGVGQVRVVVPVEQHGDRGEGVAVGRVSVSGWAAGGRGRGVTHCGRTSSRIPSPAPHGRFGRATPRSPAAPRAAAVPSTNTTTSSR
jgi:hypothetical protein